jgi:hypothetical protein
MKAIFVVGIVLIILGIASLLVPIPHSENHGVKIGDASIGVKTTHSERVAPAISAVLIVGGLAAMVIGSRTRT